MALLHISDASGRQWQFPLSPHSACTIGRAPDNCIVLEDPCASRYHAHIRHLDASYVIVDGRSSGKLIQRSSNKVLINGKPFHEHVLVSGDHVTIGSSVLRFEEPQEKMLPSLNYDDGRLGHTQVALMVEEMFHARPRASKAPVSEQDDIKVLRHKAYILTLLYELSKTLGSVFDLDRIFEKATDIIFRVTPADRVVALLRENQLEGEGENEDLRPVAMRLRNEKPGVQSKSFTIGRTITRKVMREGVALLSQDAAADAQFSSVDSIISQGVRSTMCAPLIINSVVHGALYADRLDQTASFTRDDLELLSAITAQTAIAVGNVRAHEHFAREEIARANYSRFLPEYVVRQILEDPESFKLGGVNQTITVLFADVRGFTHLAEHAPPEQIVHLLNLYFSAMSDIIFAHNGTLDKYIGDGLMALFGAPTSTPEDATNAVTVAIAMQRQIKEINKEFRAAGLPEVSIGIGLHTGIATVGYIGSERRTEYTAIGDTVNLASRLESNAQSGQILLSEATIQALTHDQFPLRQHEALTVKNRSQPIQVSEVLWQPPPLSGQL